MAEAKITLETIASDAGLKRLNEELATGSQRVASMQRELKALEKTTLNGARATKEQSDQMKGLRVAIQEQKLANNEYSKAIKGTVSELNAARTAGNDTQNALTAMADAMGMSSVGLSSLAVAATGLAVALGVKLVGAIADFARQIATLGPQEEQQAAALNAMVNNTMSGVESLRLFNTVGRDTNFDVETVEVWGRDLMNVGYSAQNAAYMIMLCSEAATGLGQGQEGANRLVDTISRIQSTGKMSSRQLIALQQAGMDMDKAFSSVGMTAEEAMDALDDGSLDAQKAVEAIVAYMEGEYAGAMTKAKENTLDAWGDLSGNMEAICASIGASIFEAFNKSEIIQTLINFTQDLLDLIWSDGESAFSEFGSVADFALGLVNDGLNIIVEVIKVVIMAGYSMIDAFREVGRRVVAALQPILTPLSAIYNVITGIIGAVGKTVKTDIDKGWASFVGPTVRTPTSWDASGNKFHTARRAGSANRGSAGGSAGRAGASAALTEEQRKVEALTKKYSDLDKFQQEMNRTQVAQMKLRASMLAGEAKSEADKQVKLTEYANANNTVIAQLERELALAGQIADANARKNTTDRIEEKIKAQRELYALQVASAEYQARLSANQADSKGIMAGFMADPDDIRLKVGKIKDALVSSLADLDAAMAQPAETDQLSGIAKILQITPEALQEELLAKNTSLAEFVEQYKATLAQTAEAETKQAQNSQKWKDVVTGYWDSVGVSLGNAFADILSGSKSAGDAIGDFAQSAVQSALKIAAQWTALALLYSAFGDPAPGKHASATLFGMKFANGGYVTGPGTSRSDSIPARLSAGEYVINAAAVSAVGRRNLDAINAGKMPASLAQTNGATMAGGSVTMNVTTMDSTSFSGFLQRGGLDAIKQALFDGNRDYTAESGVW